MCSTPYEVVSSEGVTSPTAIGVLAWYCWLLVFVKADVFSVTVLLDLELSITFLWDTVGITTGEKTYSSLTVGVTGSSLLYYLPEFLKVGLLFSPVLLPCFNSSNNF
jgi:hypothetical protein